MRLSLNSCSKEVGLLFEAEFIRICCMCCRRRIFVSSLSGFLRRRRRRRAAYDAAIVVVVAAVVVDADVGAAAAAAAPLYSWGGGRLPLFLRRLSNCSRRSEHVFAMPSAVQMKWLH